MVFTGDEQYGWKVAIRFKGRNTNDGTGRWVDEVVIELIKGQRHIEATGQHGINPEIVLMRAVRAALLDDIRDAQERGEDTATLIEQLRQHEIQRELAENGWIARRIGTVFKAGPINTGAS